MKMNYIKMAALPEKTVSNKNKETAMKTEKHKEKRRTKDGAATPESKQWSSPSPNQLTEPTKPQLVHVVDVGRTSVENLVEFLDHENSFVMVVLKTWTWF